MSNDVTLSIVSVTPCMRARCFQPAADRPDALDVMASAEIYVDPETPWRTYVVDVTGNLEPSHYAVEIIGDSDQSLRSDAFVGRTSSVDGDPWGWTFVLHGPAFDRFSVRLVRVLTCSHSAGTRCSKATRSGAADRAARTTSSP